jgi:hypothetical protein
MENRKPINTEKEATETPLVTLLSMIVGGVEAQEAQGQEDLLVSELLPTNMSPETKVALQAAGVIFLGPVPNDELFQYAQLPAGWSKQGTDHSLYSDLIDEKGVKRASIFYKAAFYDRSARLSLA